MKKILIKYKDLIAHVLSIIGLLLIGFQLVQINEHKRWENYNSLNLRYYEWYSKIPTGMELDSCTPFSDQTEEVKRWARTYFDLYSEEYWLFLEGLIPKEMWTKRIDNGVEVNLLSYPLLVRGYAYWKTQGSFVHPADFRKLVDEKLQGLREKLPLMDCEKLANEKIQG